MEELTQNELYRIDFVDTSIYKLINELIPQNEFIGWDMFEISQVRDVLCDIIVTRNEAMTEQEFYPYRETEEKNE